MINISICNFWRHSSYEIKTLSFLFYWERYLTKNDQLHRVFFVMLMQFFHWSNICIIYFYTHEVVYLLIRLNDIDLFIFWRSSLRFDWYFLKNVLKHNNCKYQHITRFSCNQIVAFRSHCLIISHWSSIASFYFSHHCTKKNMTNKFALFHKKSFKSF